LERNYLAVGERRNQGQIISKQGLFILGESATAGTEQKDEGTSLGDDVYHPLRSAVPAVAIIGE
jgi:hypothetical protein